MPDRRAEELRERAKGHRRMRGLPPSWRELADTKDLLADALDANAKKRQALFEIMVLVGPIAADAAIVGAAFGPEEVLSAVQAAVTRANGWRDANARQAEKITDWQRHTKPCAIHRPDVWEGPDECFICAANRLFDTLAAVREKLDAHLYAHSANGSSMIRCACFACQLARDVLALCAGPPEGENSK